MAVDLGDENRENVIFAVFTTTYTRYSTSTLHVQTSNRTIASLAPGHLSFSGLACWTIPNRGFTVQHPVHYLVPKATALRVFLNSTKAAEDERPSIAQLLDIRL
jgi:hypothetical protein